MRPYCPKCEEPALKESASYCSQCGEELVEQSNVDREEMRRQATGLFPGRLRSKATAAYRGEGAWPSSPHDHIRMQEEIRMLLIDAVLLAAWTREGFDIRTALTGAEPTEAMDDDEVVARAKGHFALAELILGRAGYQSAPVAVAVALEQPFTGSGEFGDVVSGDLDFDVTIAVDQSDKETPDELSYSEVVDELGLTTNE